MKKQIFLLPAFLLISVSFSFAQSISGVRFEQSGQQVNIYYNIDNASGEYYDVKVYYSTDGGESFYNQIKSATGDIGKSISAGRNNKVTWDVLKDVPQINSDQVAFKVVAAPKQSLATFESNDCLIELTDCKREGQKIVLYFSLTNNGGKRRIGLHCRKNSYIFDSNGNKMYCKKSNIVSNNNWRVEVLSNITVKGTVAFDGSTFEGDKIVAGNLEFSVGGTDEQREIRNIPIQ